MTHHSHDADSTAGHFDEAALTWDDDPAKLERARNTAQLLRRRLPLTGSERVLDIGGGTGQLGLLLADAIGAVTLVDVSPGMVDVATTNFDAAGVTGRFAALRLDLMTETPPGVPFDGAWSQLAWHHVTDVDGLLRRARAVLAPGGWLAVIELDTDAAGEFHSHHDEFVGHHGFDRDAFAAQMRDAGFRDVTVEDAGSVERELEGHGRRSFTMFMAVGYAADPATGGSTDV
jgi:ubiquinone/menaquinone biosynthesis C-methylase UbiE